MNNDFQREIWADDYFGRMEDAEFLERFLIERLRERSSLGKQRSYVINIDSGWGRGKSFFLTRLRKALEAKGYLVAGVDAWRDDHADDPIIAVMASLGAAIAPFAKDTERKIWQAVKTNGAAVALAAGKGAIKHWAKRIVGEDGFEEIEAAIVDQAGNAFEKAGEDLLAKFSETKRSIQQFKAELSDLLASLGEHGEKPKLPLFVMVDELDRCRPTYAIALLERVKHLFEIDNVVFIIATDTEQLRHSIRAVYGEGFDAEKYLLRFFDRTYRFEEPSKEAFVRSLLKNSPIDPRKISLPPEWSIQRYLTEAFDFLNLSLRDCEQTFDIFRNVLAAWEIALPIEAVVLFPLAVAFQQGERSIEASLEHDLHELARKNGGSLSSWRFAFKAYNSHSGLVPAQELNGLDLSAEFRRSASQPFEDIMRSETLGVAAGKAWVLTRLETEHSFLRSLPHQKERKQSMINELWRQVRTAGRFAPM